MLFDSTVRRELARGFGATLVVILTIVSAAIVAFIIYTMTLNKVREIAVLKLIGARNGTIAGMILQQALGAFAWAQLPQIRNFAMQQRMEEFQKTLPEDQRKAMEERMKAWRERRAGGGGSSGDW